MSEGLFKDKITEAASHIRLRILFDSEQGIQTSPADIAKVLRNVLGNESELSTLRTELAALKARNEALERVVRAVQEFSDAPANSIAEENAGHKVADAMAALSTTPAMRAAIEAAAQQIELNTMRRMVFSKSTPDAIAETVKLITRHIESALKENA